MIAMAIMLVGCDFMDDARDECPDANTVRFRYVLNGQESFRQYIDRTAYWLFDGDGNFIREMEVDEDNFDRVDICGLEPGRYSIVCIGNLRNYGVAEGFEDGIEKFRLKVNRFRSEDPDIFENGEHLFWGEVSFEVQPNDVNKFVGYMANIHFGITIKVEWETPPTRAGEFTYELKGIAEATRLNDLEANEVDEGHRMPVVENYGRRMQVDVPYRQQALETQMLALRIDDENIPSFCVYEDGEPIMTHLDLTKVFDAYGWSPGSSNFQQYSIKVLIQDNGDIKVSANLSAEVSDWEDGGAIGW